jgi:hypothetical protein
MEWAIQQFLGSHLRDPNGAVMSNNELNAASEAPTISPETVPHSNLPDRVPTETVRQPGCRRAGALSRSSQSAIDGEIHGFSAG